MTNVNKELHSELQRYLAFRLGPEHYALPLLTVREVIALPEITKVPNTPPHFLGIINLRGQVISIVDLRTKFRIKIDEANKQETAIIIVNIEELCIGVVVDSVDSVLSLAAKDIQDRPQIESSLSAEYILGVTEQQKSLFVLIDIAKVVGFASGEGNGRKVA